VSLPEVDPDLPVPLAMTTSATSGPETRRSPMSADATTSRRSGNLALSRAGLFPKLSPVVRAVLFLDFAEPGPDSLSAPWSDDDIATVGQQRLAALALRFAAQYEVRLPERSLSTLRASSFGASSQAMRVTAASASALAALRDGDIPFVISKGPGIALYSRGVSERPFTDLDVLVATEDFPKALGTLRALDYAKDPQDRPPRQWFQRYCMEAVNLRSPDGGSIDLHHHLPPWLWTRQIDLKALIEAVEVRQFAGSDLPLLPPAYNLLVSALHVVSDHSRPGQTLMAWRDVLTLARGCHSDEVLNVAERCDLVGWLCWIIGELPEKVRPGELSDLLLASGQKPANRLRLRHLLPPSLGSRHTIGQALRLPALNSMCYLAGMLVPCRQFLQTKVPGAPLSYVQWWSGSINRLLGARAKVLRGPDGNGEPARRAEGQPERHSN